jgi:hypothetical protein
VKSILDGPFGWFSNDNFADIDEAGMVTFSAPWHITVPVAIILRNPTRIGGTAIERSLPIFQSWIDIPYKREKQPMNLKLSLSGHGLLAGSLTSS